MLKMIQQLFSLLSPRQRRQFYILQLLVVVMAFTGSSAHLTKQVSSEAMRVSGSIIQPLMQMNAKVVLAIFISGSILIYDPLIVLSGLLLFSFAYLVLYKIVRKRLQANGRTMSQVFTQRFMNNQAW